MTKQTKSLKGTETEKLLMEAFAGESQARNKYTYYASQAKKDGYVEIQKIFEETAGNEKEHAELWFKALHGGSVPNTMANLLDAATGEEYEHSDLYVRCANAAKKEGFNTLAAQFEGVGAIETTHGKRYRDLLASLKANAFFKRSKNIVWQCQNCGHLHVGKVPPMLCPVCAHPRAYFQENPKKNY